jgi:uncharacterized membrane protein
MFRSRKRSQAKVYSAAGLATAAALTTAAVVYFLNPRTGRRRREQLREQATRVGRDASRLFGIGSAGQDGVVVDRTIQIDAGREATYSCWRKLESFPEFMSHVREVSRIDDTHYHWKVDGPAGVPVEWDAVVTADVPGELIAWRTMEGSAVQSSGVVMFEPASFGGTRVHVRMSYRPPVNVVGHTVAKIFGRDPQRQIESDLVRFKSYMETGKSQPDSEPVIRH